MSMMTLQLMMEANRREEKLIDDNEKRCKEKAKEKLSDEETKERGDKLYDKLVKVIKRDWKSGKSQFQISCKFQPHCVFNYVVDKFKSKGWKAKHSWNYGYNFYDFINVTSPNVLDSLE